MEIKEDIGQSIMEKMEQLDSLIDKTYNTVRRKVEGKKNSHLHFVIETNVIEKMKKEAQEQNISLSEWCRRKLREDSQLNRIERKIDKLTN